MRSFLILTVLSLLVFTSTISAAPPDSGRDRAAMPDRPGKHMRPSPENQNRPHDIAFFGMAMKGEEMKPFLLSVMPLPPVEQDSGEKRGKQDPSPNNEPMRDLPPHAPRGFLGIDAQGYVLSKVQLSFSDEEKTPNNMPRLESIKAAILDIAPPDIDPAEMEKKTEEKRQEIGREFEEKLKTAEEIGTMEITFAMRSDLKSPIMTDIEILAAEGKATVNGENYRLFVLTPPPPPKNQRPGKRRYPGGNMEEDNN